MFIVPITQMPSITLPNAEFEKKDTASVPFADMLKNSIDATREAQAVAAKDSYELAWGNMDDLHNVTINSAKAVTSLQLTVQLVSKVVSAYNEVMRMQV